MNDCGSEPPKAVPASPRRPPTSTEPSVCLTAAPSARGAADVVGVTRKAPASVAYWAGITAYVPAGTGPPVPNVTVRPGDCEAVLPLASGW